MDQAEKRAAQAQAMAREMVDVMERYGEREGPLVGGLTMIGLGAAALLAAGLIEGSANPAGNGAMFEELYQRTRAVMQAVA